MRKTFEDIIKGWHHASGINDIPPRLELIKQLEPLEKDEEEIVKFMKDVQNMREKFGKVKVQPK